MPRTAAWFSQTFPEVLRENTVANALPVVSGMAQYLPQWLLPAIPTQRSSKQLNTISDMVSIFSFLPGTQNQQQEKLATIAKIRERTEDRQIRFLPDEEKDKIREFRKYLVDKPLTVEDLPEWIKLMFKEIGIKLVDFKIEFGKTADGEIVLADEISPDCARLWDEKTNKKLDKDRFRRDLGNVIEAYEEIYARLQKLA